MKSGVAAMTHALAAIETAGFGLQGDVTLEAVIEEECTGNGALACLETGYNADAVLIPEPFSRTILTGQVGVLWFKVRMYGVPKHVQDAAAGVNAVEKCFVLVQALRALEARMNEEIHPAYREFAHPLNLNIGIIKGGDWPSTVPAEAEFHGRLSFFPGVTYREVCDTITQAIERAASEDPWMAQNPPELDFYAFRSEGHLVTEDLPLFRTLSDCHAQLTGSPAITGVSTATTDVRVFHHFGQTQATCYGPYAEKIHAANERVDIDSIIETAKTYALFLSRWCGLVD
jgi:acetylornithine deacetylase